SGDSAARIDECRHAHLELLAVVTAQAMALARKAVFYVEPLPPLSISRQHPSGQHSPIGERLRARLGKPARRYAAFHPVAAFSVRGITGKVRRRFAQKPRELGLER